jgi:signal transduction histidine kinase
MRVLRSPRQWITPISVALIGIAASCAAFWIADRVDEQRVRDALAFRAEWRARDIEAKLRLSANAVENVAIAAAVVPNLAPAQFDRIAARARRGVTYVNALQWAPRVRRENVPAFEAAARASGLSGYGVFDVNQDLTPTKLTAREEYFPVLYDTRADSRTRGLALGRFDGRRIPMEQARDRGTPVATLPVRPVGPRSSDLVYLLFWPVYQGIDIPDGVADRRSRFLGFAIGNFSLSQLLNAAIHDTPDIRGTIHFVVGRQHQTGTGAAAALYDPATGRVATGAAEPATADRAVVRVARDFDQFGQHWDLTFDYGPEAVAGLRSNGAWGWLLAGLLLTGSLVFYVVRAQGRRHSIEALVDARTAELQRTSAQLQQAQKMEAVGNLSGGMAHDFNNLLMVVLGNLELLADRLREDRLAATLVEAAMQAATRGAELTQRLLAFARRQPLAPKITDVNALVASMTRLLERMLEEHIKLTLVTGAGVWPVMIDPAQLSAAIANLVNNARDALPDGGRITVETRNTHLDTDYTGLNPDVVPGDYVLIEVSDTGTGMTPETLTRAFEPFFTTKEAGTGTGLGLSMVFGFVKQSQGHIKIYSEPGQGTTVRLYLPRYTGGAAAEAATAATPANGHETVLLVEDKEDVRRIAARQLADLGYTVLEAENGPDAMRVLRDPAAAVDLLFTDLIMPGGMNGHDLARAAQAIRPGLKVLFTSGYPGHPLRDDDRIKEGEAFLAKPFRKQDLARKLREVLDGGA